MQSHLDFNLLRQRLNSDLSLKDHIEDLLAHMQYSEYDLVLYMEEQNVWIGTKPPPPAGYQPGSGSVEFGLFLFWMNNPAYINSGVTKLALIAFMLVLNHYQLSLPATLMDTQNYDVLSQNNLVYTDGSILGTGEYETYDQGWFTAFFNLVITVIMYGNYNGGTIPAPPSGTLQPIQLTGASPGQVVIAMTGDWGASDASSVAVMNQLIALKPDYIIHLGDVYYSGSPNQKDYPDYYTHDEEINKLLDAWPGGYTGKSFALNSNHEMYSGANGLFTDILRANNSPFTAQGGLSFFALQYGGWTLLGLDSAYSASIEQAYMYGSIGGVGGPQGKAVAAMGLDPSQVIVLTHHNGFDFACSPDVQSYYQPFWNDVNGILGGDPYAWYWGHVHNGIVYAQPVSFGGFSTQTYCRCLGHGSLPFANATELGSNTNVAWYETNALPGQSGKLVSNGFTLLTLQSDNDVVNGITEAFYDISDASQPVWQKQIYGT